MDWHDHASALAVSYTTRHIVLHDGRWSARLTISNETGKPLYEAAWKPDSTGLTWDGPALLYAGHDVLGFRALIYVPADTEKPAIPFPLRSGRTWSGLVEGRLPTTPLPHGTPIWMRYPVFGVGQAFDGVNSALGLKWISEQGFRL